jgi:D-arabinose 1-dehydrogenase-like Zn-dependent alcohol dehydrogenase
MAMKVLSPDEVSRHSTELDGLGAGYITKVGFKVAVAKAGDPVGLSFTSCLSCRQCKTGHPAYCNTFMPVNIGGKKECFQGKEGNITGSSSANLALQATRLLMNSR